jgi:hypothetical protein
VRTNVRVGAAIGPRDAAIGELNPPADAVASLSVVPKVSAVESAGGSVAWLASESKLAEWVAEVAAGGSWEKSPLLRSVASGSKSWTTAVLN